MIKFVLLIIFLVFGMLEAFSANPAIIFGSGGMAKTIPVNGIQLSNGVSWRTLSANPTITSVDAPQGSFGSFGAGIYIKQDSGDTTNWLLISTGVGSSVIDTEGDLIVGNVAGNEAKLAIGTAGQVLTSDGTTASWQEASGLGLIGKGSIITSDGVTNGELLACENGQFLEYDSNEDSGMKCVVPAETSPTEFEGDLIQAGAGAVDERLPIGTAGQLLTSNGTTASWEDQIGISPVNTEGDIIVADVAGEEAKLAIGTVGQVLTSDGTTVSWEAVPNEIPVMYKGSLMTSTGGINGEFGSCADDEILIYDSTAEAGLKCGAPSTSLSVKGDLLSFSTEEEAVPVGTDGQILSADSTEITGIKWIDQLILGLGVLGKGSILTSNGLVNGEFEACADGEILEWDTAEVAGVKCVAKPAAGSTNYQESPSSGISSVTSNSFTDFNNLSVTITTAGNPVRLFIVPTSENNSQIGAIGGIVYIRMVNGATSIGEVSFVDLAGGGIEYISLTSFFDTPSAGTHTYKVQGRTSGTSVKIQHYKLVAIEL